MAQFLSDEWVRDAHKIYDDFQGRSSAPPQQVRINLNITSAPFGEGTVQAHLDTTGDEVEIDLGHLEDAPTTITTDYDTAKSVFIDQDSQAAMQAFMTGKVKITGDMTKVMMLMQASPDPTAAEIGALIRAITD